jgi:hypothetical protein
MVLGHPSRIALSTPPITSSRISAQPTTRHRRRGRAGRERHDAAHELSSPKSACAGDAVLRTSTRGTVPMGQCAGCHRGHVTSLAPRTTGWREDRCPVVSKPPLHSRAAAKMSPHIRIGLESVLAAHAPSPPAAGSHRPAKEDSAPHCGTEFFDIYVCACVCTY